MQDAELQEFSVGQLCLWVQGSAVRGLFVNGEEVLRGLEFMVRDAGWGTLSPGVLDQDLRATGEEVRLRSVQRVQTGTGLLTTTLELTLTPGGLTARAHSEVSGELLTNRAGFVLLHPAQLAGQPFQAEHAGGEVSVGEFPTDISPAQPARDLRGLRHATPLGASLHFTFAGPDPFEMEDQRNWTDASFKTYSRPLALPMPYRLTRPFGQEVELRVQAPSAAPRAVRPSWHSAVTSPQLGLALSHRTPRLTPHLRRLARDLAPQRLHVWLDLREQSWPAVLADARTLLPEVPGCVLNLEVVLPGGREDAALGELANQFLEFTGELTALPEAYLRSHQPGGPWPAGLTPADALELARPHFPQARLGTGALSYFTEFNRCPPAGTFDFVTHGTSALVHAGDDRSVMQTLEALPSVFASARHLAPGVPYLLAPSFIGMRLNPYGDPPQPNPQGQRRPLSEFDPRHSAPFGAAWSLGYFVQALAGGVDGLTLAELGGPFGLSGGDGLFPLAHLLRGLRRDQSPHARTLMTGQVAGVTFQGERGRVGYLANLTGEEQRLPEGVPAVGAHALLGEDQCLRAAQGADWLFRTERGELPGLPPYALLRWEER